MGNKQAEEAIVKAKYDKEYLPITGFGDFTKNAAILAYGKDSKPLQEGRVSWAVLLQGSFRCWKLEDGTSEVYWIVWSCSQDL